MWDNRESKKMPTQPDFVCRDKTCKDGKFVTALWEKDLKKVQQATVIRDGIDGYSQPPAAIAGAVRGDAAEDDLPF